MLSLALVFVFLYALIHFCEKDRDDLDGYVIGGAVVIPVIIVFIIMIVFGFLGLGAWLPILSPLCLLAATYLVLTLNLEIKPARAAGYTAAVVVFHIVADLGVSVLFGTMNAALS
jgi:hypothetical protein